MRGLAWDGGESCEAVRGSRFILCKHSENFCFSQQSWCAWQDLNLHTFRHYHLKVACLPIPPHARDAVIMNQIPTALCKAIVLLERNRHWNSGRVFVPN